MAAPFAFVPRAVSKYTKEWQGISRPPPSPSPPPDLTTDDEYDEHPSKGKEKANELAYSKQSTIAQDIASLISLALSDYNIWLDYDLRWKLDACLDHDASPNEAAFVPINYLLRRAPYRGSLPLTTGQPEPSETEVVKALRTHASQTLEVRMRLPSSSSIDTASSVWYGAGKTSRKKDVGGYEVRRRDWATLRDRPSRGWSRAQWDVMTAYMECIPPQYRTVGGIARFAESLFSETARGAEASLLRVQCVTLPLHYLDKPGDVPKCKGYALVTFSTQSDLDAVLDAWPWKRHRMPIPTNDHNHDDGGDTPTIVKEAHKYGLRAISKARWDVLNEEYLAYKRSLVDEVARLETDVQRPDQGEPTSSPRPRPQPQAQTETEMEPHRTTLSSPYPFDCLVFVRNVHPDTNKTMLKSLFAQAFQGHDASSPGSEHGNGHTSTVGIDYVDFTKGMDTCYLRLASPAYTTRLMTYFDARPITQVHGLDATGRTPVADDKPITMEKMQGKREVLYWENIPDKVRRQAVDRVVQAQLASGAQVVLESASALATTGRDSAGGNGRKKRTREH